MIIGIFLLVLFSLFATFISMYVPAFGAKLPHTFPWLTKISRYQVYVSVQDMNRSHRRAKSTSQR